MRTVCLLLFMVLAAHAEDIYIAQNALGGEMSSAATATNLAWFNTAGNWGVGASKISAGDTVHFVGALTNKATFQAGGTAGNVIRAVFEPGASFILAIQTSDHGINCGNNDYISVDGAGVGYITWTNSGSFMVLSNTGTRGVITTAANGNVSVANLMVSNAYVFLKGSASTNLLTNSDTVHSSGVHLSSAGTNLVVTNCTFYRCEKGVAFSYSSGKAHGNVRIVDSRALYCAWLAGGGDANAGSTCNGLLVSNCTHTGSSEWQSSDNGYHLNATYFWAEQGGGSYITNPVIAANTFGPDLGDDNQTACIFFSASGGARILNPLIINNVLYHNSGLPNGTVKLWRCSGGGILHNTFESVATGIQLTAATNVVMTNNLFKGYGSPVYTPVADGAAYQFSGVDYNWYYLTVSPREWGPAGVNWGTWQGAGFDVNGATNQNPLFVNSASGDFKLQASSPAILAAPNTYTLVKTDRLGNPRPASGNSTFGAFEFVAPMGTTVNVHNELRVGTIVIVQP